MNLTWLLPLLLVQLNLLAPLSHGFSTNLLPHTVMVMPPSRTVYQRIMTTSLHSATSPPQDDGAGSKPINAITDYDSDNIDDVRRARSLVRRDRLARWRAAAADAEDEERETQDNYFLLLALLPTILAFVSWENISFGISEFLDMYGVMKSADGNTFANNLLRPTITGVVVPVISIALATLVSTTVNVLRQRQVDLRAFINKESCELRLLRRAIFGMFGTRQHAGRRARALALLCGYVEELMSECTAEGVDELEDKELSGGIAVNDLDRLSAMFHGVDGAAASRQESVSAGESLIVSLSGHRSERVAMLLTVFPIIHWGILFGLCLSICVAFLLTSNQQVLQYLNSIQLRFLFAVIVGVCSGTATLCWDLGNPFSGTFSIASASTQLADLRVCLREDVRDALAENGEISSQTRTFFRTITGGPDAPSTEQVTRKSIDEGNNIDSNPPSRYGLLSTIYFHLLTGPFGPQVRAVGDIISWLATLIKRRKNAIKNWSRWPWKGREALE